MSIIGLASSYYVFGNSSETVSQKKEEDSYCQPPVYDVATGEVKVPELKPLPRRVKVATFYALQQVSISIPTKGVSENSLTDPLLKK